MSLSKGSGGGGGFEPPESKTHQRLRWRPIDKFALHQGEPRLFEATCLVPLAEEHQSMRLHIHKPEYIIQNAST
jgi:hypothetical protein